MLESQGINNGQLDRINELWRNSEGARLAFESRRQEAAEAIGALLEAVKADARVKYPGCAVRVDIIVEKGSAVGVKITAGEESHVLKRND